MRGRLFAVVVCSILIAGIGAWLIWRRPSCAAFSCVTFPDRQSWRTVDTYENGAAVWRGMLGKGESRLRLTVIRNVAPQDAAFYRQSVLATLEGLYEPVRSPYPGMVSQVVRCDPAYVPVPRDMQSADGRTMTYYHGFLTGRMTYGACVDSQVAYRGYAAVFYCAPERIFVHMEYLDPAAVKKTESDYMAFLKQSGCRR